jgi:hypothetical protein
MPVSSRLEYRVNGPKHFVQGHAGMLESDDALGGEPLPALATLFQAVADSAFRVILGLGAAHGSVRIAIPSKRPFASRAKGGL